MEGLEISRHEEKDQIRKIIERQQCVILSVTEEVKNEIKGEVNKVEEKVSDIE